MNNASHLFFVVVLVNICIILHYRLHKDGYHCCSYSQRRPVDNILYCSIHQVVFLLPASYVVPR